MGNEAGVRVADYLQLETFEYRVPRLAVGAREHGGGFFVADDGLFFGVPLELAAGAE